MLVSIHADRWNLIPLTCSIGTMMSLSLVTIPLFLDTNTQVSHMLRQWHRLYSYGHVVMPGLSVGICGLYLYKAMQKRQSQQCRALYTIAGLVTIAMIPFTLTVMWDTNQTLSSLAADDIQKSGTIDPLFGQVQELVASWGRMHFVRSCFPLAGAALGFTGVWEDFTNWPFSFRS